MLTKTNKQLIKNCVFAIFSEESKSNYSTLPNKKLKLLLVKNINNEWSVPTFDFINFENPKLDISKSLSNRTDFSDFYFESNCSFYSNSENAFLHSFFSILSEKSLEDLSFTHSDELHFFSLEEVSSLKISEDDKKIIFGDADNFSIFKNGCYGLLQNKILTTDTAKHFLSKMFTISELLLVIQSVVPDFNVQKPNFVTRLTDCKSRSGILSVCLDENGDPLKCDKFSQKPAQLYSFNEQFETKKLSIYNNFK